ncbi:hypothetical protein Gbfr_021_252 [Gluconobacter frateurii M-2]|nr:hypothetical protein Gbfr_021_252 [Gluconobacter frateurii M-2]
MAQSKTKWWPEAAENRLWEAGIEVATIEDMPSGHGSNIRTRDGRIVCVYNTGSLVCQGKLSAETKILFEEPPSGEKPKATKKASRPTAIEKHSGNPVEVPNKLQGVAYSKSREIVIDPDACELAPWE